MLAQVQKLQKEMEKKQEEIQNSTFVGESELVEVTLYGSKKIKSVKLKVNGGLDEEDVEILEDMIKIAVNDGINKIEKEIEDKMGVYGKKLGGLM
jgi:DNA-binding YbaB/EbfC family protein